MHFSTVLTVKQLTPVVTLANESMDSDGPVNFECYAVHLVAAVTLATMSVAPLT